MKAPKPEEMDVTSEKWEKLWEFLDSNDSENEKKPVAASFEDERHD